MNKLYIDDVMDLRQYEKVREEQRKKIIALKQIRRVGVGPFISLVFENRETMLFQIQEMARAERIIDEKLLQEEIDIYNNLIPELGEISITLLIELTSKEELYLWLPRLVGIEDSLYLELHADNLKDTSTYPDLSKDPEQSIPILGGTKSLLTLKADVQKDHQEMLTREDITASVHYLKFYIDEFNRELFRSSNLIVKIDHPEYRYATYLSNTLQGSILDDWSD
ncbi:MAG: DUF3501 family protein [Firmicutes bacterium]|nr:DUF3501 family protein [Bacillota bacterium]